MPPPAIQMGISAARELLILVVIRFVPGASFVGLVSFVVVLSVVVPSGRRPAPRSTRARGRSTP